MLRRNPSKIELKLDDLQELDNKHKGESEAKKNSDKLDGGSNLEPQKTRQEIIHERIGYNPKPRRPN